MAYGLRKRAKVKICKFEEQQIITFTLIIAVLYCRGKLLIMLLSKEWEESLRETGEKGQKREMAIEGGGGEGCR